MDRRVRRLVVGLGNPGPDYAHTRHNVGFDVLDHLALHEGVLFGAPSSLDGYRGPTAFRCARLHDPDALLVKPETFMNRSGDVVLPVARWAAGDADPDPGDLLVVYDDLDLDIGRLRIRPHGSSGGQKGMRSIIERLETDRFPRLRIGIGRAGPDAARHVLSRFTPDERVEIDISVAEAAGAVLFWLRTGDLEACMSRFHSRWNESR